MAVGPVNELEELRGLVHARTVLDREIQWRVRQTLAKGADRSRVAHIVGVSRASLYRHYMRPAAGDDRRIVNPRGGESCP